MKSKEVLMMATETIGGQRCQRCIGFDQVAETALKKAATAVLVGCGGKMGETGEKVGLLLLKRPKRYIISFKGLRFIINIS